MNVQDPQPVCFVSSPKPLPIRSFVRLWGQALCRNDLETLSTHNRLHCFTRIKQLGALGLALRTVSCSFKDPSVQRFVASLGATLRDSLALLLIRASSRRRRLLNTTSSPWTVQIWLLERQRSQAPARTTAKSPTGLLAGPGSASFLLSTRTNPASTVDTPPPERANS